MPTDSAPANPTAEAIIARLPRAPLCSSEDIAAAIGARTTTGVLRAITTGDLSACRVGGRYIIARAEAERWIRSCAVVPDEGTL